VVVACPESRGFLPVLLCRDRRTKKGSPLVGYELKQVETESVQLRRRYDLEVEHHQDEGWQRELFSPAFILWLVKEPPAGFGFELAEGTLCVSLEGHLSDPVELDRLLALAAHVAERIRRESLEEVGLKGEDAFRSTLVWDAREVDEAVSKVSFAKAPLDVPSAVKQFGGIAGRHPSVLLATIPQSLKIFLVLGGAPGLIALAIGLAPSSLPYLLAPLACVSIWLAWRMKRYPRAARYGLEAFLRWYARLERLELEDGRRVQATYPSLDLPGRVSKAMSGPIPGAGMEGHLCLVADDSAMTKTLITLADMPPAKEPPPLGAALGYYAVVFDVPGDGSLPAPEELASTDTEKPPLGVVTHGRTVAAFVASRGNLVMSRVELDSICRRAGVIYEWAKPA
jgi:hypothetical protein